MKSGEFVNKKRLRTSVPVEIVMRLFIIMKNQLYFVILRFIIRIIVLCLFAEVTVIDFLL